MEQCNSDNASASRRLLHCQCKACDLHLSLCTALCWFAHCMWFAQSVCGACASVQASDYCDTVRSQSDDAQKADAPLFPRLCTITRAASLPNGIPALSLSREIDQLWHRQIYIVEETPHSNVQLSISTNWLTYITTFTLVNICKHYPQLTIPLAPCLPFLIWQFKHLKG